jgi:endoglucanase
LAAAAAQGARIWREFDPSFADQCLRAAEHAFEAAQRQPALFAAEGFDGGGAYEDVELRDEVYWAAAELYLTTGDPRYGRIIRSSPFFLKTPGGLVSTGQTQTRIDQLSWRDVAGLGTISLSMNLGSLSKEEMGAARAAIIWSAEVYLSEANSQGYRQPDRSGGYAWGSNGAFLNRSIFMALAEDYTGQKRFRDGVIHTMDYMLGRNPNDVSFVSGYGSKSMQNPHHRFWAKQKDPTYPGPPPGALSGGVNNTNMADPLAKEIEGQCAPLRCWQDHIDAYSLNEVAINWNAPLFWVAAYLDEQRADRISALD